MAGPAGNTGNLKRSHLASYSSTGWLRKGSEQSGGLGYIGFAGRCVKGKDDGLGQVRNAVIGHRKQLASTSIPFPVTGLPMDN